MDYDPFSHEVMLDPHPTYNWLRDEAPVHYLEKYDAWALSRFDDVWQASTKFAGNFTWARGTTPGQILLGEPTPATFMVMDPPQHHQYRRLIQEDYSREAVAERADWLRSLTRDVLASLLERGELDVHTDLAGRVSAVNAMLAVGLPPSDGVYVRGLLNEMLAREPHQVGSSPHNYEVAAELHGYLESWLNDVRANPLRATGHVRSWLTADVNGRMMDDEEILGNVFAMLVVGAEVTPLAVANTVYYLDQHRDQLARVVDDPSLAAWALGESLRYDQPTNLLLRVVERDFEFRETAMHAGQPVIMLFASANRDEREFEQADVFDIDRRPARDLSFGHGLHKCLGEYLGITMGTIVAQELFAALGTSFTIDPSQCVRQYGEFLSGYSCLPIRFAPMRAAT